MYSGQEAIAVGIQSLLTQKTTQSQHIDATCMQLLLGYTGKIGIVKADNDDQICDFAQYIEKYSQAKSVMSELMAKQTGCSKGKRWKHALI